MRRIKAFTLIELTVAMLIGGIVIGTVYYALLFFNGQYHRYRHVSGLNGVFFLLKRAIRSDFGQASMIVDAGGGRIQCYMPATEGSPDRLLSEYRFTRDCVLRQAGEALDSFMIHAVPERMGFVSDSLPLLNALDLSVSMDSTRIVSLFTKEYSAAELLSAPSHWPSKTVFDE